MSIYIEWAALVLISFIVDVLGLFVVPFAIWCSDGKTLPQWARWWDNDKEPLGDGDRKPVIEAASGIWRGFLRWRWLCLRNPGNNFSRLLGFRQMRYTLYKLVGDPLTSDQGHPGWLFVTGDNGVQRAFCFYYVKRWGRSRCLRIFLGWKIHDTATDDTPAQIVCVVNPFMTFEERASA